ncbi:beta-1,4-N-acetylgalactosaminyltransferase bre-4 [Episyrphus balteatus]|uniref:beta-1,4-N-acetylgalactosaminyltransferase bre-4 n=1 Tax=Episyrphus balteatus TaxID=286459 RepID=UPI002484DAA3|nr:beta-1,4-N-acetylgalactosaminyltransferase bre-4 [Episyrphus balteatus]
MEHIKNFIHQKKNDKNFCTISKTLSGIIILYCLWPGRFATRFDYISSDNIYSKLVPETTRNISLQKLPECNNEDVINQNQHINKNEIQSTKINNKYILPGGEFYPKDCRARFSTAIIVPYRQRQWQLNKFLVYMHNFLEKQQIHYRIFLVEQHDDKPFNRAKLLNIGAEIALGYEFPCLIFHDVDILPSNLGQLYACSSSPRHMCSNLDIFRYNLPYRGLFGGVVSIRSVQFQQVNGMSNLFSGWGGEDDDFYERITSRDMHIVRFDPSYSEYIMMVHKKEKPSEDRLKYLYSGPLRYYSDGLNSLNYKRLKTKTQHLYTHVLVDT